MNIAGLKMSEKYSQFPDVGQLAGDSSNFSVAPPIVVKLDLIGRPGLLTSGLPPYFHVSDNYSEEIKFRKVEQTLCLPYIKL